MIGVWAVPLFVPADRVRACRVVLSPRERERADRLRLPVDRSRFTVCRWALRTLLGSACRLPPEDVRFVYGVRGKPRLADAPEVHFNLTHARGLALIAVGDAPVGIDVEYADRIPDTMYELIRCFFSPAERRRVLERPAEEHRDAFFRCWTRKEALIKACGEALHSVPADFAPPGPWSLLPLTPVPGYLGALAVRGGREHLGDPAEGGIDLPDGPHLHRCRLVRGPWYPPDGTPDESDIGEHGLGIGGPGPLRLLGERTDRLDARVYGVDRVGEVR
ncbi:4'-phosphopantetheinyl transferase family protein [Streptomyces sp. NBC_00075]|uniref:4'-phosphopantetheinyl transferase family protein n=1 Tax=Streptomyces sp. NBC_00075 TaxID=2975641 RepID=UPI003867E61D